VERGAQSYSVGKGFNLKILEKSLAKRKTLEKSLAGFEWQDLSGRIWFKSYVLPKIFKKSL
jgi:hypothetical protein